MVLKYCQSIVLHDRHILRALKIITNGNWKQAMLLTCLLVDKYFFSIRLESSMAYCLWEQDSWNLV